MMVGPTEIGQPDHERCQLAVPGMQGGTL